MWVVGFIVGSPALTTVTPLHKNLTISSPSTNQCASSPQLAAPSTNHCTSFPLQPHDQHFEGRLPGTPCPLNPLPPHQAYKLHNFNSCPGKDHKNNEHNPWCLHGLGLENWLHDTPSMGVEEDDQDHFTIRPKYLGKYSGLRNLGEFDFKSDISSQALPRYFISSFSSIFYWFITINKSTSSLHCLNFSSLKYFNYILNSK